GSALAKVWNMRLFKQIRGQADAASRKLAEERGACPDAAAFGIIERFSNKLAIAPTDRRRPEPQSAQPAPWRAGL
ncbi:MAG: hypothetical protein VXW81_08145, partial [Pseudomonadota bacterium]|nr:hypothetical protein [Pseudomonadota bacterium]